MPRHAIHLQLQETPAAPTAAGIQFNRAEALLEQHLQAG
jgi:hypothetical protein